MNGPVEILMILLNDKTIEKPTQEKNNELYELFLINEMRENEINFYLKVIIKWRLIFHIKKKNENYGLNIE